MFDHSYFNYGQMALLRVEVHGAIWSFFIKPQMGITRKPFKQEVEPKFKEAAFGFRHRNLSAVWNFETRPIRLFFDRVIYSNKKKKVRDFSSLRSSK